jgi:hypothetical protein
MMALASLGSLLGAVSAGFLGEFLPVVLLLVVQGSGYVIASLVVAALTRRERAATEPTLRTDLASGPD